MSITTPTKRRDGAIDLMRGLALVSMTTGHLAHTSPSTQFIHFSPGYWFDGASGFVLLSGLVLGIVQQSRVTRGTLASAQRTVLKRTGLIYVVQIITVIMAFAAGAIASAPYLLPQLPDSDKALATAVRVLLLQVNPFFLDILSLYVILLLLAIGATMLLQRGHFVVLGASIIALYAASQRYPQEFTLPRDENNIALFNWGSWQLLFLAAFVVGWFWKKYDLARRLHSMPALILATGLGAAVIGAGIVVLRSPSFAGLEPTFYNLLDKGTLGLGRILLTCCLFVVLYWTVNQLGSGIRTLARPLEVIGRRGLESYVILTLVQIAVPLALHRDMAERTHIGVAALILMYLWAQLHDWFQRRKSARGLVAADPMPRAVSLR